MTKFDAGVLLEQARIDTIEYMDGRVEADLYFNGTIADINKLTPHDILQGRTGGNCRVTDLSFKLKDHDRTYHNINASLEVINNDIEIHSLTAHLKNSDFNIKGRFINAISWLLFKRERLGIEAQLKARDLYLDELLEGEKQKKDTVYSLMLPTNLTCNLDMEIDRLRFKKFRAKRIFGTVKLNDQLLVIEPLTFDEMQGTVTGGGSINGKNNNQFIIKSNARFEQVSIGDLFYALDNFGQAGLTHKNLKGRLNSSLYFSSTMFPNLKLDPASIYAIAGLLITSGELINYKPLMKLSKFLDLDDLAHIRFDTLENMIEIKNQQIIIPEMEINSSLLDLNVQGSHGFNNNIDYRMNLLLSEILSVKFKTKNPVPDEFGVIEDDGLGRSKIFLKITGNTDDPVFGYDTRELKEKMKADLKDEKEELKKAMQEEFHWLIKDSTQKAKERYEKELIKKQEEGEFIIEWEEDTVNIQYSIFNIQHSMINVNVQCSMFNEN